MSMGAKGRQGMLGLPELLMLREPGETGLATSVHGWEPGFTGDARLPGRELGGRDRGC